MSLSDFQIGNWNVKGVGGFGLRTASRTIFVDFVNGSDDNPIADNGNTPESAKKTIGGAFTAANAWDVIYIAPKAWVSGNLWLGTGYVEAATDLSLTYAKQGVAVVGIGHQGLVGPPYGTVIGGVASGTGALLKVHAPMCAFENLAFEGNATAINGLYIYGDSAGVSEAVATSVYNCHFHGCLPAGATGDTGGAIYSHAAWGTNVDTCTFMGCRIGVSMKSDAGTSGKFMVKNSQFFTRLLTASDISADIYVYTQGSAFVGIENCQMGHSIPVYTAGHGRFIIINADVRQGYVHNCTIGLAANGTSALTHGPAGTGIIAPWFVAMGANYSKGAICTYA